MATSKLCFVTVGATASFNELVSAVLKADFLSELAKQGYTELRVQYGKGGQPAFEAALSGTSSSHPQIIINGFELERAGLGKHMREAKGNLPGKKLAEGVVLSHAGSGTILDALRMSVPLIVVPNASLLDNHQIELAEALAQQGYVVHGHLNNLGKALAEAEALRTRQYEWPPVNSGKHREYNGLKGILDEEMGFLD